MKWPGCVGLGGGAAGHKERATVVRPRIAGMVGLLSRPEHWEGTGRALALVINSEGRGPGNRAL